MLRDKHNYKRNQSSLLTVIEDINAKKNILCMYIHIHRIEKKKRLNISFNGMHKKYSWTVKNAPFCCYSYNDEKNYDSIR